MFGQQTDDRCSYPKLMTNVWSANGYTSAHATVCAIRQFGQPFDVQCMSFSCDNCLYSHKSVIFFIFCEFSFSFCSNISIKRFKNKRTENGRSKYSSKVCAQADTKQSEQTFRQPLIHKRTANGRTKFWPTD